MSIKMHDGTLYDYTASCYCGVLIKQNVMRKLVALQQKHLEEVKRLLSDESDKGNVFPSDWTLHYPEGKQTEVRFINTTADVNQRLKYAMAQNQPQVKKLVFIASSISEAEKMADEHYKQLNPEVLP